MSFLKRTLPLISLIVVILGASFAYFSITQATTDVGFSVDPQASSTRDFSISASPSTLTLAPGASGISTITTSSLNGLSGSVKLSGSVLPPGLSLTFSSSSVLLSPGTSTSVSLNVSTTKSTATGSYVVTVTGKSGRLSHSSTVTVNVVTAGTPPALDGSSNNFCGHETNSCSTLLSTSNRNDVIIVYTVEDLDLQASCTFSVSDTSGLQWTQRAQATGRNQGTTDRDQIAEFWAVSSNPLTNDDITESILGCAGLYGGEYNGLMAFGISGANTNTPFDSNPSLPATSSDNFGTTASVQLSTSNPADMIIGGVLHGGAGTIPTAGPGFTIITSNGAGANAAEYETVTTVLSNAAVSFGDPVSDYWEMIGDAVQGANGITGTAFGLDGSNSFFCGHDTNSCSTTLSTTSPNDIIVVYATESLDLQTSCSFSVSDTAGLTWNARSAVVFSLDGRDQIQEFWAQSPNPLSSDTLTEFILGCAGLYGGEYNGIMAFGISGANYGSPFDPNLSLPSLGTANSDPASVQVSTSHANDMIIAGIWHGANVPTAGPGFTIITSYAGGPEAAESQMVNTTQSSLTVSFQDSVSSNWVMVADAVQSA